MIVSTITPAMTNTIPPGYTAMRSRIALAAQVIPNPLAWANEVIALTYAYLHNGSKFAWYIAREDDIIADEGGYPNLVEYLSGRALVLALTGDTINPKHAVITAMNEWRAEIRPQYDYRTTNHTSIEKLVHDSMERMADNGSPDLALSWVDTMAGLATYDTYPCLEEDQDAMVNRLPELMELITPMQRAALQLYADGMGYQEVADTMGLRSRQQAYHLVDRARNTLQQELTS